MEIIGHRGAAGLELENTISGILKAIEIGVKWIEIDVWKTTDDKIIVFHDAYLDRLSNQTGFITKFSYEELKQIELNNGDKIPTLEEVIKITKEKDIILLVELKSEDSAIPTLKILEANLPYSQFIIGSFFHEPIKQLKHSNPQLQTSIMFEGIPLDIEIYLKKINPDYVTISIETYNEQLISIINNLEKKLIFYTINSKPEIELAKLAKPFGIVTNYPNLFM